MSGTLRPGFTELRGVTATEPAHAIGLDLSAPGSQDWIGKRDEEGRYLCVWPPPYWGVLKRNDGTTRRCAGYDGACIEDLLQRLANISLLDGSGLGANLGCSGGAIWGQDIAEYRMKLSLPDPTAWLTQEHLEKTVQEVSLQMFQTMARMSSPQSNAQTSAARAVSIATAASLCPVTKACGSRLPESPTASTRRRFGRTPMDCVGDRQQSAPSAYRRAKRVHTHWL